MVVWIRLLTLEDLNWNGIAEFQKKEKLGSIAKLRGKVETTQTCQAEIYSRPALGCTFLCNGPN